MPRQMTIACNQNYFVIQFSMSDIQKEMFMTSMITARVDAEKRKSAEKVFSEVGLTTSGAVNRFICAVAMTGGIPFPVTMVRTPGHAAEPTQPQAGRGGVRIGLADNRFHFRSNFDSSFDSMDSEVAELFR